MSLRRALERLPHDWTVESTARDVLALLKRHPGRWFSGEEVRARLAYPRAADAVLSVLVEALVLDFEDSPPRYMYHGDPLVEIELERYLRRARHHDSRIQNNVARFRRRFHCS